MVRHSNAPPCPHDNRSHAASERRGRGSDLAVTAPELYAGAGVGRLGTPCPSLGDVMRVLLVELLVGIAGCGGAETSPDDVATPSSPAISPVKSENAAAGAPKTKPASIDDLSDAELADLLQALTDLPSDQNSDDAVAEQKQRCCWDSFVV